MVEYTLKPDTNISKVGDNTIEWFAGMIFYVDQPARRLLFDKEIMQWVDEYTGQYYDRELQEWVPVP